MLDMVSRHFRWNGVAMIEFFRKIFDSGFMSHGQSYLMRPEITWLHVVSDSLIAMAYFSILVTLACFVHNRRDLPYYWMFVTFGLFIFACGVTHLMEIWSVWHGTYRLSGVVKAATAVASVATSIMLVRLVPQALTLPAPDDLRRANVALEREIAEREQAETALAAARDNFERQVKEHAEELLAVKDELAAEQEAMTRLHEFGTRMLATTELQPLLEEVLMASIALQSADFGTIQLYNAKSQAFELVAHRGFRQDFLDHFSSVRESEVACGRALSRGERVIIEDVLTDADFEPHRPIAASAGFRAVQSTPLLSCNGEPLGMVSTHFRQPHRPSERDLQLTDLYARQAAEMIERKQGDAALMESEERFSYLIEAVRDYAIFMLDPGGRVVAWNRGAERIKGYRTQEILGQHISLFYEPGDVELKKPDQALNVAATEGRFEDEGWRVRKDGSRFWANVVLTALKDDTGGLRGFAAVTRDLTERKRAEEELRRSEAYLAQGQRLSHTGSWGWNASAEEVFWSRETFRILGADRQEVRPSYQFLIEHVHPEDRAFVEQVLDRANRERTEFEMAFRIVLPDGSIKHIQSLGHPAPSESGPAEFVGAIVDVTGQRLAEEALAKTRAQLARVTRLTTMGELAASIAHEANQALSAIVSNSNFCLRLADATGGAPYEAREALLEIVKDADRANAIIARIRTMTQRSALEKTRFHIRDLVFDVLALAHGELDQNRIKVRTDLVENLPHVSGDRVELQQVLLNLVMNSIEAMSKVEDERRVLTICGARDELDGKAAVRITVQDYGVGFRPEAIGRLFDAVYSTKPNGLGMGLQISRTIVEAHGGRLWATANAGPGATFLCALPTVA
jgi:PAS domain S-box-containing protein